MLKNPVSALYDMYKPLKAFGLFEKICLQRSRSVHAPIYVLQKGQIEKNELKEFIGRTGVIHPASRR
jgi:hypothetical protein